MNTGSKSGMCSYTIRNCAYIFLANVTFYNRIMRKQFGGLARELKMNIILPASDVSRDYSILFAEYQGRSKIQGTEITSTPDF